MHKAGFGFLGRAHGFKWMEAQGNKLDRGGARGIRAALEQRVAGGYGKLEGPRQKMMGHLKIGVIFMMESSPKLG